MPHKLLGHFQTDETAANHHGATCLAFLDPRFDALHIRNIVHREMTIPFNAGKRREKRACAGGKNQRVVGLLIFTTGVPLAHFDQTCRAVNARPVWINSSSCCLAVFQNSPSLRMMEAPTPSGASDGRRLKEIDTPEFGGDYQLSAQMRMVRFIGRLT